MKTVLITGAYGGMGRAASLKYKSLGYRVIALDIKASEPEENIYPIEVDLREERSVKEAYERVKAISETIDIILHFAGVYMLDSLVEMDSERFKKIFEINLYGAYLVNKTFLPLLGSGSRIVITTSELAPLDPLPFTGIYAVSKAALDKYAYSLRMELQLLGIQVSVLRAGAVDTGMIGDSTRDLDRFCETTELYKCNSERFKRIVDGVEARRISTSKLADKVARITSKKKQKFAYRINPNPLLLILNALPKRLQFFIIKKILK